MATRGWSHVTSYSPHVIPYIPTRYQAAKQNKKVTTNNAGLCPIKLSLNYVISSKHTSGYIVPNISKTKMLQDNLMQYMSSLSPFTTLTVLNRFVNIEDFVILNILQRWNDTLGTLMTSAAADVISVPSVKWRRLMESMFAKDKLPLILHTVYNGCLWPAATILAHISRPQNRKGALRSIACRGHAVIHNVEKTFVSTWFCTIGIVWAITFSISRKRVQCWCLRENKIFINWFKSSEDMLIWEAPPAPLGSHQRNPKSPSSNLHLDNPLNAVH